MSNIVELDAVALSHAIHKRQFSCREVMTVYLARIDRLNPQINAIISRQDTDRLLRQADIYDDMLKKGHSLGWMHGFPIAIKELASVKDMPWSMCSPALKDVIADRDDIQVERIKAAGAIIIGKTNTPEFGMGSHSYNPLYGSTKNPYNLDLSAGGSSGGAAACLAAHMLPVADGSDMMGSLRNPASFCNIIGFRPSFGRIPYDVRPSYNNQFSVLGPMGRTVADVSKLLAIQAGYDPRDPSSLATQDLCLNDSYDLQDCRIGWMADLGGYLAFEAGILPLMEQGVDVFRRAGAHVEKFTPDFDLTRLWFSWTTIRSWQAASSMQTLYQDKQKRALIKPETIWEIERGMKIKAQEVADAILVRNDWMDYLLNIYQDYDYLLLPSAQVFPFPAVETWPKQIGEREMDTYHRWMEVVIFASIIGLPAISMPVGFSPNCQPAGIQIIGKPRDDKGVLQCALAFETARGPLSHPLDPRLPL